MYTSLLNLSFLTECQGFQKEANELHPEVIKLGLQYASGASFPFRYYSFTDYVTRLDVISGASLRCLSLLDTLAMVIESFSLSVCCLFVESGFIIRS